MSDNRLRFEGLDELRAALRQLPETMTAEASHIVESAANAAASEIKQGYASHVRTGHLQDGVSVSQFDQGRFATAAIVKNTAKHAFIFEHGTQARHTDLGANRGSMPAGNVFIPVAIRQRRKMNQRLVELVQRQGFTVTGDVDR